MPTISQAFNLGKSQPELDFVDVELETDNLLFLDPFALSQQPDAWSQKAHSMLTVFFQAVVDAIRGNKDDVALSLLSNLREPNETRLGFSVGRPQGAGIGSMQANQLLTALKGSTAVKTGFISSLEECELMVDGISNDKLSDLATNIVRSALVEYTQGQCDLHNIPMQIVPVPPCFDPASMNWVSQYQKLPVWQDKRIIFVPKVVVRYVPAYSDEDYYRYFVLNYLQQEELHNPTSRLIKVFKTGPRVFKKDIAKIYPKSKEFLYRFSKDHPQILKQYREYLELNERSGKVKGIDNTADAYVAEVLISVLQKIVPGPEAASAYHSLMVGLLEFLFYPSLLNPIKEREIHDGRKRIDIYMENGAKDGAFYALPNIKKMPCPYVVFECKNYSREVGNPELDQIAGRFSTNRGRVGFLCCREFEDRQLFVKRCQDTLNDGRGLIIPLDDNTIIEMLKLIRSGQRRDVDHVFARLIAEIWLS